VPGPDAEVGRGEHNVRGRLAHVVLEQLAPPGIVRPGATQADLGRVSGSLPQSNDRRQAGVPLGIGLCRSPDTNQFPIWVRVRLCLYADFLLVWVVGESESELLVDLGAVGWVGSGEGGGSPRLREPTRSAPPWGESPGCIDVLDVVAEAVHGFVRYPIAVCFPLRRSCDVLSPDRVIARTIARR
jgi:hypothetical protein